MAIALDTLAYARRLREAGFSDAQAEGQAEALAAAMTDTLATKQDLGELGGRIDARFAATKQDLSELEGHIDARFAATKQDLSELEGRIDARFAATKQDLSELEGRIDARFAATKQDLSELRHEIREVHIRVEARFEHLEKHLDTRLAEQEKRTDARLGEQAAIVHGELADLERRMTMRLGTVTVAAVSIVSAIVKLL